MNDNNDILYAFDDYSIETTRGVTLEMVRPDKHPDNPIVPRGKPGDPDAHRAETPAVIYDGGRWRMWYVALTGTDWHRESRVAYAESDDGLIWRKPELGLSEFNGSRKNNLVDNIRGLSTIAVMRDDEAPPERRYVMVGEDMSWYTGWVLEAPSTARIDVSADGLHWTPLRDAPGLLAQMHETATVYKFKGQYHIGGHQVSPLLRLPMQTYPSGDVSMLGPRTFVLWRSPRLDRWPQENTKAFFKPMRSSSPYAEGWDGEQVHLGAAVTPCNNVCLGVYGQWHHPPMFDEQGQAQYDGHAVSVDLGLVLSNDGLHFREPAPGFTLVARDQELGWDRDYRDNEEKDNLLLLQGPLLNTAESTRLYYSAGTPGGNIADTGVNIGLATWPRDRLGYLRMIDERTTGQFVSCTLEYPQEMQLCVNADVPAGSSLQVSLLDEHGLDVLPGYSPMQGGHGVVSGLDVAVCWETSPYLPAGRPFKIRCDMTGKSRVFALYLKTVSR